MIKWDTGYAEIQFHIIVFIQLNCLLPSSAWDDHEYKFDCLFNILVDILIIETRSNWCSIISFTLITLKFILSIDHFYIRLSCGRHKDNAKQLQGHLRHEMIIPGIEFIGSCANSCLIFFVSFLFLFFSFLKNLKSVSFKTWVIPHQVYIPHVIDHRGFWQNFVGMFV